MSLAEVLHGDFATWPGLDGSETVAALRAALAPVTAVAPAEERERKSRRFAVVVFARAEAPARVEAWLLAGEEHATLIEYDDPPVLDLDVTLAALGPPAMTRSGKRFAPDALVQELVFAGRGLTLSVAAPFDPAAGPRSLVHVQLYAPQSATAWLTEIGAGPEVRPYPLASVPRFPGR